ncbi:unnamed protein product [Blepharisma stoltei]|uniref:TmcB/TmcC TPR repeats domain-containing protein n=1 Tax=Blepharisma stoltei TaxID=1481888 RepID=A0AAU9INF7_9CILI|nr:unnamed protein product [Blepharisma stoltei]
MSFEFHIDQKESVQYSDFLTQSLFSSKIKTYFYGFLGSLFKIKYHIKTKPRVQMLYEVIINSVMTLQLTTLVWYPDLGIEGWASYKIFWKWLGIVSYDQVCASWNIMGFCFYGTLVLLAICIGSFWIFGTYIYFKKEPPVFLAGFPQKIAFFLTSVCLIPSTMISLMVLRYSFIPKEGVEEYDGFSSGGTINFGIPGAIFSIICIISLVVISVFSELFTCDIKHSHSNTNLKARSSAALDFQRRWFYVFMCFAYTIFSDSNIIIHHIISAMYSIYLFIKSIVVLQYYNVFENSIQACEQASISMTLLIFIFGQIMDNAMITVFFTLFLQPLVLFFTFTITKKNYQNLPEIGTTNIRNQFDFERKFRHLLIDNSQENKEKVLNLFKEYWNLSLVLKDKIFIIWEFYYCLYLKDERLARIKLSKISSVNSSIEGDIQVWRIFKWLAKSKYKPFPDVNYLQYLKELGSVKKFDEELCLVLVELQAEFSLRSPRIDKLIKLVNKTSTSIKETSERYKSLIEKHKNFESYDLYASFLDNITGNHEEANLINRKKNNISHSQKYDDNRLEKYGKGVGVILVSCAAESFGSIVYLNEKAATTLKTSISTIHGSSIMTFIPPPYDISHEKLMKKFIFDCISTQVSCHQDLVFQCTDGFLLECDTLIKLSAFHNSAYFLISFKPKKTSRHIALVSDEGFIISHSISFPYYFSNEKSLRNRLILEIIPDFPNLKQDIPSVFSYNGKEIGLVSIKREIKLKTLNYLLVIHDSDELVKWKLTGDKEIQEIDHTSKIPDEMDLSISKEFKKSDKELKLPEMAISRRMVKLSSILPHKLDSVNVIDNEEIKEEGKAVSNESSKHSSTTSSSINSRFSKKLLLESKSKIRVLQWVLFFGMASTLACVIGILAYMASDITHTTAMSAFSRQGNILFDLGYLSDLSRTLDRGKLLNAGASTLNVYYNYVGNLTATIENLQNYLLDDFRQWSYCPYSIIISEPIMPQWNFDKASPEILYKNFYDTISDFIYAATNLVDDMQKNRTYSNHIKFIAANGLGFTFDYVNRTMNEIVNCEVNRVKSTGLKISALLIFGFGTLGVLMLIISGYIMLVSRQHDQFWNFVLEKAQFSLVQLKVSSIDRLFIVHGIDFQSETISQPKNSKRKIYSKLHKKYIWRLSLFFIIVASYYLLIYCYLYPSCEKNMINRPQLLNNFNIRRSLLSRMTVWAREISTPYLTNLLRKHYPFENPSHLLDFTLEELNLKTEELKNEDFLILMSDDLKEKMFEKGNSTLLNQLFYGTDASVTSIKDLIYYIKYWGSTQSGQLVPTLNKVAVVENVIGEEFLVADKDSKDVINGQLSVIIYTTVIYSFAVIFLYFIYYLPYSRNQIKQMDMFEILPTILTMESG